MNKSILIFIIICLQFFCKHSIDEKVIKIKVTPLELKNLPNKDEYFNYFEDNEKPYIGYLSKNNIAFYDIIKKEVTKLVFIDTKELKSIKVSDLNTYSVEYSDKIILYNQNLVDTIFTKTSESIFPIHNNYILSSDNRSNVILREILDYNKLDKNKNSICYNFIDEENNIINYNYPDFYYDKENGMPISYLTSNGLNVVISCEREANIWTYNPSNGSITPIEMSYKDEDFQDIPKANGSNLEKMEISQYQQYNYKKYGKAFYDNEDSSYIRIYQKTLKKYNEKGEYQRGEDKERIIIQRKGEKKTYYSLPKGIYMTDKGFHYNKGKFSYITFHRDTTNNELTHSLHHIYLD